MTGIIRVPICSAEDAINARGQGRELARRLGFASSDVSLIVTAISELTRNILQYAGAGEISLSVLSKDEHLGIEVKAEDSGPGIVDIRRAMQDGYSTSGGLGMGLPGVRRIVDEYEIESEAGKGTRVTVRKWRKRANTTSSGA